MRFAEYVIGGWALTAGALTGYWFRLGARIRRAERLNRDA
jgi:hypothetical protein